MTDEERHQAGVLTPEEYAVVAAHASRGRRYDALVMALRALEAEMRELGSNDLAMHYADKLAALLKEHNK